MMCRSLGGIIYSIVFHRLEPRIGFGWATRIVAFIMLGTLILPITCLKMRIKPSSVRRLFDRQAWTEASFLVFAGGCFIGFVGLYIPYFYIETFALQKEIFNENTAFYLVSILNAGSFFGRIVSLGQSFSLRSGYASYFVLTLDIIGSLLPR